MIEDLIRELLHGHHESLRTHIDNRFNALQQRIEQMSENLSQQLDAADARSEAALGKISSDLTAIAAELKANNGTPGSTLTQAQVDRNVAIATSLEGVAAAADALAQPAPAP